ncbi:MAG TPA: hypothetical protein VHE35_04320 [Kofleriaceae bacterium]|nr:hypothetical protein [Kofleriaceae bacterium]
MPSSRHAAMAALGAVSVILGGCLSHGYVIPHDELVRLSQTAPGERGARVEVVQQLGEDPPPAQGVNPDTEVVVVEQPIVIVDDHPGYYGHHRGGGVHGGSSGGGGSGKDEVIAALVIAATAAVTLAVTEGQRFAGDVRLHPMHPVHLWGPWGQGVLPLAQIDPTIAAQTTRAEVSDQEGPWLELDRAPLDRKGWTYAMLAGAAQLRADDGRELGPAFHVQLGRYPSQRWGLVMDWTAAWRDTSTHDELLDLRWGLELQALPLAAGRLHAGGFLNGSYAWRSVGDVDESSLVSGGGALVQVELSTYLALTGRVGILHAWGELTRDVTVGLSIF